MGILHLRKRWTLPLAGGLLLVLGWLEAHTPVTLTFSSFYFVPVALAAWSGGRPWGFAFAAATALAWLWADLSMAHEATGQGLYRAISVLNHLLAYGLATWLVARLHRAMAEVEDLQGLLPVCAWCRKVRDDQGLWQGVEAYLQGQGAKLTHGICPECQSQAQQEMDTLKSRTVVVLPERKRPQ